MAKNFFDVNDKTLEPSEVHRKDSDELYETAFNEDQKKVLDNFEPGGGGGDSNLFLITVNIEPEDEDNPESFVVKSIDKTYEEVLAAYEAHNELMICAIFSVDFNASHIYSSQYSVQAQPARPGSSSIGQVFTFVFNEIVESEAQSLAVSITPQDQHAALIFNQFLDSESYNSIFELINDLGDILYINNNFDQTAKTFTLNYTYDEISASRVACVLGLAQKVPNSSNPVTFGACPVRFCYNYYDQTTSTRKYCVVVDYLDSDLTPTALTFTTDSYDGYPTVAQPYS